MEQAQEMFALSSNFVVTIDASGATFKIPGAPASAYPRSVETPASPANRLVASSPSSTHPPGASNGTSATRPQVSRSQFFNTGVKMAWQHFQAQRMNDAKSLATRLLYKSGMTEYHRGVLYFILANSGSEGNVENATKAVLIFEKQYRVRPPKTDEERVRRQREITTARLVRRRAMAHRAVYGDGHLFDDCWEELVRTAKYGSVRHFSRNEDLNKYYNYERRPQTGLNALMAGDVAWDRAQNLFGEEDLMTPLLRDPPNVPVSLWANFPYSGFQDGWSNTGRNALWR